MRFVLPWPTRATNNLYLNAHGKRVLAPEARAWRQEAVDRIALTNPPAVPEGGIALFLHAIEPDKRRRDTDGLIKPVQDAVAEALGFDDTRVRLIQAVRLPKGSVVDGIPGPCVIVDLEEWS